jgi:hypothetical protein
MAVLRGVVLQNVATVAGIGTYIPVGEASSVLLTVGGTSTNFTINFETSIDGVLYVPIDGNLINNTATAVAACTTSTLTQGWQFDVPALTYFRANLITIANGNINVVADSCL